MNPNKLKILGLSAIMAVALACEKQESKPEVGESSGKQVLALSESDWTTQTDQVSETLTLESKILTPEGREKSQKIVRESSLEALNLPTNYNVNAFTVRSKSNVRTRQAVFLAPKLYFYRKADGAKVLAKRMGNNVLIPLHAILVDGLSSLVPGPGGIDTVPLPDSYKVDLEFVKKGLAERGYDQASVGPLDGCAKDFTISVAGVTYDVTPTSMQDSDYCEINRPFTVNLVVPQEKADFIINEALYMSEIDATASFQVQVGYIDSDTRIQLDRSKVYERLEASLQGQYPPYVKAEVSMKLKSIIQEEAMNIFIKGDRTEIVTQLVNLALNSFAVPFELQGSPESAKPECKDMAACVTLNYEKNKEQRTLEVSFQQYSTTLTEKKITSSAKPQQILFPEIVFNSANDQQGEFVDNRPEQRNERNLAVTVNNNTVVELSMIGFRHQIDKTDVAVTEGRGSRCASRDWTKRCEWTEHSLHVSRNYAGVGYSDVRVFSGNILGQPESQLFFRFTRMDGTSVKCSLSQLNANATGTQYVFKVANSKGCEIFADSNSQQESVTVSFINELRDPQPLRRVNDGSPYQRTDTYLKQDSPAEGDTTQLGGYQPAQITEAVRSIQLQVKVLIRKYEMSELN